MQIHAALQGRLLQDLRGMFVTRPLITAHEYRAIIS
jgi:hypothetical protein